MSTTQHCTGITDRDELYSLLSSELAWDGRPLFEWRYHGFPGFDPDEHAYSIVRNDEIAAFRRIFAREVSTAGETVPVHVYGGTVVHPDHRGEGLYTELLERTDEYSRQQDVPIVATFNRTGTITYEAKRERGWNYRRLPLQIRVLSPSTVLKDYAGHVVDPESLPDPLKRLGSRLHVDTSDGRVHAANVLEPETDRVPNRTLGVGLTDEAVADLVDAAATADGMLSALGRAGIGVLRRGNLSVVGSPDSSVPDQAHPDPVGVTIERRDALDEAEVSRVVDLLDRDRPTFRRERHDVEHLLSYPNSDTFLAFRDGELVGISVLGPRPNDGVTEGWLLEHVGDTESVSRALAERAVRRSVERGYDLVAALSDVDLGRLWADVDRQVIMWKHLQDGTETPVDVRELDVSLYDAL